MSEKPIRILIADDHAIVRAGLQQFITEDPQMHIVGIASTGKEAIECVRNNDLDVVLLDIAMPEKSGVDALRQIKAFKPNLPVLILSAYPEECYAINLIKAGANGYLNKECAPEELLSAIRMLVAGKRYVSQAITDRLLGQLITPTTDNGHENLSQREFQILCQLAKGESITAIAQSLCLSVKTISTYRTRLFEKMGFHNNADAVLYALKTELID